jgi:hypothetical protein
MDPLLFCTLHSSSSPINKNLMGCSMAGVKDNIGHQIQTPVQWNSSISETIQNRTHVHIHFCTGMTDIMTSHNIDISSWDILYYGSVCVAHSLHNISGAIRWTRLKHRLEMWMWEREQIHGRIWCWNLIENQPIGRLRRVYNIKTGLNEILGCSVDWPDKTLCSFGEEVKNISSYRAQLIIYFTHHPVWEQGLILLPKLGVFNFLLNMDSGESQKRKWFHMDWYSWETWSTLEFVITDVQTWKSYQRWSYWSFISLSFCTSTKQIF